jgi:hypothetical protein
MNQLVFFLSAFSYAQNDMIKLNLEVDSLTKLKTNYEKEVLTIRIFLKRLLSSRALFCFS